MRKAGDPGMVEAIRSFLTDNPVTHSWRDSVGGAINWAERQVMSDDDLRNTIGSVVMKAGAGDRVTDDQLRMLERLKGAPIERSQLDQGAAEYEAGAPAYSGWLAGQYMKSRGLERDALKAELAAIQGPLQQNSEVAHAAALLATHPAAAYSAVTAGGAMATAGGMAAYDWWMAQQQQAQKEAQLPLVKAEPGL